MLLSCEAQVTSLPFPETLNEKTKAHLSVLAANLIFGVNFSVVKYVTPSLIAPFGLNVVRVIVTTTLFWLMWLFRRPERLLERGDIPRFIACGITGVAINQLLFIKGLSITYSTHASLLMLCTPIMITVSAFFLLKERLSMMRLFGLLLGISGAVILILSKDRSGKGENVWLGDLLIILNAISYSIYFILVKPLISKYSPIQVIRWVFTFGGLFILPFGWHEFVSAPWMSFMPRDIAAIAFVVLGATFLAYLLNTYGLLHLKASATGAYIYLQPLFAAAVSMLFLHEPFSWEKLLAAVLIFAGVWMVNRRW
jgi:drug/metabolite transporter (DMT)-like permease